ncbi:MAG: DUF1801 domain-containing protein [Leptolyngbyaceae cyanobacterium]
MADLKTQPNDANMDQFIQAVADDRRRADCLTLLPIMERITQKVPQMWGDSIIGFGRYHYKYRSGREGNWFVTGFSPRKREMTVYIMPGFENYGDLLAQLGQHRLGKSCLYIKRLADIDLGVLETLVSRSIMDMAALYDCS